ncbi:hypothetical protein [Novosphingopyxis sp.]|uniref:hypothetical protein n=1 Tax=Novosphingopyxis sp. TaxID=2709690 RepID=UPI003B5AFEF0
MANGRQRPTSLLRAAERIEREQPALLADLSARLFPRSQIALDDASVASARAILFTLVGQIEAELMGEDRGLSWPIVERNRLLDDPHMLWFLMAHAAFLRVSQRITAHDLRQSNAWLAGFAADDETLVGQSALDLLSARSRPSAYRLSGRLDLAAPLFRLAVQQVDAALHSLGVEGGNRRNEPRDLLTAHDEAKGLPHIATKLAVQLAGEGAFGQLRQPRRVGLDLFAGSLAAELDCDWYAIVRIMTEGGPRLAIMLRAADFDRDEAMALLALFQRSEPPPEMSYYDEIAKDAARRLLPKRRAIPKGSGDA